MEERHGLVTMKGNPLTLTGQPVTVGQAAPDFEVLDNNLKPFTFSTARSGITILSSVPSLDTPVCDLQTRRFNGTADQLGPDVHILTISMDLPFAQKRWCGAAGVEKLQTLSDHRLADFGRNYGLLIKELRLLARAVLVVDRQGLIAHYELVPEIAQEPDYEAALQAVKRLLA